MMPFAPKRQYNMDNQICFVSPMSLVLCDTDILYMKGKQDTLLINQQIFIVENHDLSWQQETIFMI